MTIGWPAPRRNFSPWFQVVTRLMATEESDRCPTTPPGSRRGGRFRARLDGHAGAVARPGAPRHRGHEEVACDGYRGTGWSSTPRTTMSVPGLPPGARRPQAPGSAVLAVHGHGPGKSRICGVDDPDGAPGSDYAAELARRGHVVLAPDLRCFGERADWNPPDHYACDTNLVHQVMAGWNPLTQNLWDLGRALDVLEAHPLVDPSRMGVVGFSYGGTMALFLAACDHRVAAAVVSGYFSSWAEAHKMPWNMCGSQVLYGMLGRMEHVDLGALIAPRPLLVVDRARRPALPGGRRGGRRLPGCGRVYDHSGPATAWCTRSFDGEHQWHGDARLPVPRPRLGGSRPRSAAERLGGSAATAQRLSGAAAPPSRGRGRRWRGACAGGSRPGTTWRPGPPGRARTGSALRASGTTARTRSARSSAGMVTVMARAGTSASVGEVALVDLLAAARRVELDHLDVQRVVEVGHRRVVEGQVAVLADPEAAQVERVLASSSAYRAHSASGRRQPVEVVGGPRAGRLRRSARGSSAGSRRDGRGRRPRTRPCGRRRRPPRGRTGRRTRARRRRPAGSCRWRTWRGPRRRGPPRRAGCRRRCRRQRRPWPPWRAAPTPREGSWMHCRGTDDRPTFRYRSGALRCPPGAGPPVGRPTGRRRRALHR